MIAIGCDHGGFVHKQAIMAYLKENNIEFKDYGTFTPDSIDYAPIAQKVCNTVVSGENEKGILVCGTGIGMSIAANKVKGIRAAVCSDEFSCEFTRRHNDANILCLGGRVVTEEQAIKLVSIFLNTEFEGGRHQRRVEQIAAIERGEQI